MWGSKLIGGPHPAGGIYRAPQRTRPPWASVLFLRACNQNSPLRSRNIAGERELNPRRRRVAAIHNEILKLIKRCGWPLRCLTELWRRSTRGPAAPIR